MTTTPEKMAQAARTVRALRLLLGEDGLQKFIDEGFDPLVDEPYVGAAEDTGRRAPHG